MSDERIYEPPELCELGSVKQFTLGKIVGCRPDDNKCHDYDDETELF